MTPRQAHIVGVGTSERFGFDLGKSPMTLAVEAFAAALADAGLDKAAVDGLTTAHGSPGGVDYDEFAVTAGLGLRWASQLWSHGRWATTLVTEAALVVLADLADYVAILNVSTSGRGYGRHLRTGHDRYDGEAFRDAGGGHGEWGMHGIDAPGSATALVARRYMDRYGATEDDLARIAMTFRASAGRNPMAIMRDRPMSRAGYDAEPVIAAPFRRADYCLSNEGATCLIVTTPERAAGLDRPSAAIAGMEGVRCGRDDYILFGRPGLGVGVSAEFPLSAADPPRIYRTSGVARDDIDALYVYDSFASNPWMVLERFGFCGEGEAPALVRDRGIGLDAPMPVNTNGGLLSEAHLLGLGHVIEMVRQLRGEAGERQLPEPAHVQWATPIGDSLILAAAR